ncbi:TetR/AcrR family transcriptional regulator [Kitasatospora saccharophila]|uniref:TetR/AcrR family transcriptional regulator n=1 Tax=Kitasatospora saccharophila TaxID=407973 RepID=A0ABN2W9C2_9ACTN
MRADARKNRDHLLAVARVAVAEQGADASLRDIARRADVALPTLYRHFPTREALLDALLREGFDALADRAAALEASDPPEGALVAWLRDCVALAREYRGVTELMAAAIADPDSALHTSCVTMRAAGTRLLTRAQDGGAARADLDGAELFALVAALAWLGDHGSFVPFADHLFTVITDAVLTGGADRGAEEERH